MEFTAALMVYGQRMTDRTIAKRKERARKAAGYTFLSGYTSQASAPSIQSQLMSAEEVDRVIQQKEEKGDE